MKNINLTINPWPDYELLDSGDGKKLERYGRFTLIRPETQALWAPRKPELWKRATAEFQREGEKGIWKMAAACGAPEKWEMKWRDARFEVRLTSFKHTGVFPEQAANWEWIATQVKTISKNYSPSEPSAASRGAFPKVLNLFGYTGIASIVAAQAGAQVTHVDASKQSNAWAKENAKLSGVPEGSVRYLLDDALKFVEREVRRGAEYEGIVLDPPAFGRGAKGEVWHIEEDLPRLLVALTKLLSKKSGSFFLLNGYAAGYSPRSFKQIVDGVFHTASGSPSKAASAKEGEFGELQITESGSGRVVPSGIYVRFVH
jgi:23S rRNA (cytosine1962-C5)-methyltransferase